MTPHFLDSLTHSPCTWLDPQAPDADVVLSSRLRLARNLTGLPFPGRADDSQRRLVLGTIEAALPILDLGTDCHLLRLPDSDETTRLVLMERHLISRELCCARPGGGLCLGEGTRLGILVNEEDHYRLQSLASGLDFQQAWEQISQVDDRLCQALPVAFDPGLGFLTACPSNVGTGMRASAMMWLPALALGGHVGRLINGAHSLGLTVRGLFGEGTEALGQVFQISNQSTLGESESAIILRLEKVVRHLVRCERAARFRLTTDNSVAMTDLVGRAYGLLRYARELSGKEAVAELFALRLGVLLGCFERLPLATVDNLLVEVQRGHLASRFPKADSSRQRRLCRAELVRSQLAAAS